jgi:hypothetical protein
MEGTIRSVGVDFHTYPSFAHLDILKAGSHAARNPLVIVQDLGFLQLADPHIRGILGGNFLGHLDVLIDYVHGMLCLDTKAMQSEVKGKHIAFVKPPHPDGGVLSTEPLIIAAHLSGVAGRTLLLLLDSSTGIPAWYYPGEAAANMVMRQQNPVVGKGEGVSSFVHIDDAAIGTVKALAAAPGVYNLVDDDPSPQAVWLPAFAKFVGAPVPPHMSEAEAEAIAGQDAVYYATKLSGASNARAKRVLGWKPRRLEWLEA